MTVLLVAQASIAANVTNHVKIAIADFTDETYDSAVFLEAWSSESLSVSTVQEMKSLKNAVSLLISASCLLWAPHHPTQGDLRCLQSWSKPRPGNAAIGSDFWIAQTFVIEASDCQPVYARFQCSYV